MTVAAPDKAVPVSVKTSIAQRDSAVVPSAVVRVWALVVHVLIVASPAMACSTIEVMLSLTTSPQVPASWPDIGRANFSVGVNAVIIFLTL